MQTDTFSFRSLLWKIPDGIFIALQRFTELKEMFRRVLHRKNPAP